MNPLETLTKRLAGLLVKRPSLTVGLWGSHGIGKTFAAQRLLQETPCRNLSLHATTSPSSLALALPRPKKLPTWAERILEKLESDEFVETSTIIDALGAILTGLAPFVLHLEDVHEVAPDQLEFIQNLARVVQRLKGVGLIVTSRTEPPEPFEIVLLQALSSEEVKAMLEREAGATLPNECLEWIQTRAVGNPLYTLEFFRFLARQGFVWNDGQRWRWRVPEREVMPVTVEALIERALVDAIDTPVLRDVLGAKAVLPVGSSDTLWATTSDQALEMVQNMQVELERRGVLVRGEFTHPLYREVMRNQLSLAKRRSFARRALEALRGEHPDEATAFVGDAALEPEGAVEIFSSAAAHHRILGDRGRAGSLLARALEYLNGVEQGHLALEAAALLETTNQPLCQRLLGIAVRQQPDNIDAIYLLARSLAETGRWAEVEQTLGLLPETERIGDRWTSELIHLRFGLRDFTSVLELFTNRSAVGAPGDPLLAYEIGFSRMMRGDQEGAEEIAQNTLNTPDLPSIMRSRLLTVCAFSRMYRLDLKQAELLFDGAVEAARESGEDSFLAAALHNRSILYENLSRASESHQDSIRALRIYRETGEVRRYASALTKIGRFTHEFGDYEQAEEFLLEAHDLLRLVDASDYLMTCEGHLSALYYDWGTAQSPLLALKYAQDLRAKSQERKHPKYIGGLYKLALVLASQGQADQAIALAREAERWSEEFGGQAVYQAQWALGMAFDASGQTAAALQALNAAVIAAKESEWDVYAEKIALEVDRIAGDLESARQRLAWFESRGLMNGANIARRYFPQLSAERPSQLAKPSLSLHLEFLGPMRFSLQDKPEPVRGRKRQELLALLLEARIAGRNEVSKLELLDALYPDSDEDQATNALQETVRTTRSSLRTDVIATTTNGYALGAVTSDAEEFLKSGNTNLWRGAYLDGLTLETRDDTVRESLHLALFTAAMTMLETDAREVARVGRILLDFDGYNLDYLELCAKALRATSNHKSLTRLYAEARDRLLEVGEVIPERWQDFLERSTIKA